MKFSQVSREPGFRLNGVDLLVLAAAAALSGGLASADLPAGVALVPAYVAASFFLFCNVLRVPTRLELLWSACFVTALSVCFTDQGVAWTRVLLVCEPLRAGIVAWLIARGQYRGVFSSRILLSPGR